MDALEKWELTNLKFYSDYNTVMKWAVDNTYSQEIFEIIEVINNATDNLCKVVDFLKRTEARNIIQNMQTIFSYSTFTDIQNAEKIKCYCIYHKIAFIKLMEKPFIQLVNNYDSYEDGIIREKGKYFKELKLDSLPFSIFPKLLQLFKPLENITCGHPSFPLYIDLYVQRLALFLDPRSNPDEISTCKDYYLKKKFSGDLDKSTQAAYKELECYINRPQSSLDDDINPYEWWQGSKQMLPGLAALAREYLPTLTVDEDDPIKNLDKLIRTYNNNEFDKMAEKIAFLQYNMKYIDLYL
ncbi:hypothetical protein C2G38_2208082 [Gigaspora rosea]|uniref:HAT C-terminal dimerisation domain-containing protein n=1 Tax=Gigaspora rosea TaxID=44941 RepID=A0A397ULP8_9GLOM|nr:hypothetical protein C2G38_2208082 [Gigaspora rosea]